MRCMLDEVLTRTLTSPARERVAKRKGCCHSGGDGAMHSIESRCPQKACREQHTQGTDCQSKAS